MKRIVNTVRGCENAYDLGHALNHTVQPHDSKDALYVKLPDGSVVFGYDIEEETLSDGSKVYNIILKAE